MDPKTEEALRTLGVDTSTPVTPSPKRVLWGVIPAVLLALVMMALLVLHTIVAVTGAALDGLARVCAFGVYGAIGSSPPAGKWPRAKP
jgi:hypothetical protein